MEDFEEMRLAMPMYLLNRAMKSIFGNAIYGFKLLKSDFSHSYEIFSLFSSYQHDRYCFNRRDK